jgi:hypothetical protein
MLDETVELQRMKGIMSGLMVFLEGLERVVKKVQELMR